MEKTTLSKRIKFVMIDKGIKGVEIADHLEVLPQSYYNMLYRGNLTINRAEKIAAFLDCDIVLRDRETGKIY